MPSLCQFLNASFLFLIDVCTFSLHHQASLLIFLPPSDVPHSSSAVLSYTPLRSIHISFAVCSLCVLCCLLTLSLNSLPTSPVSFHVQILFSALVLFSLHSFTWTTPQTSLCWCTTSSPAITSQSENIFKSSLLVIIKSLWLWPWPLL